MDEDLEFEKRFGRMNNERLKDSFRSERNTDKAEMDGNAQPNTINRLF